MVDQVANPTAETALTQAATSLTATAEAVERLVASKERSQRPATPRRGLSRLEAAEYVGISATMFDKLVHANEMPAAIRIGKRTIWDIRALDQAFEAFVDPEDGNPWDAWGQ